MEQLLQKADIKEFLQVQNLQSYIFVRVRRDKIYLIADCRCRIVGRSTALNCEG